MGRKQTAIGVGIIGAGLMGGNHADWIAAAAKRGLVSARIAAVADPDAARGKKFARKHKCALHAEGEALIADPAVDAVVIASPTFTHLPMARAAAAAGKPIFLEKPIGRSLAEAEEIAALIKKSGVLCQIGLILRFSPTYTVLKSLVDDPKNGALVVCRFRDDQAFPTNPRYGSSWRADAQKAGGGALIEHSIHDVDALHWLFGEPEVAGALFLPSHAPGIEKLAALNLRFEGGGVAQLASAWHRNETRPNERDIEIFFENRYIQTAGGYDTPITLQGPKGAARVISKDEIHKRFAKLIGWRDAKNAKFACSPAYEQLVFLRAVQEGRKTSAPGLAEGLAAHRLIEAAYRWPERKG